MNSGEEKMGTMMRWCVGLLVMGWACAGALAVHWHYFFHDLVEATKDGKIRLGIAPPPGAKAANGEVKRFVMVGGQGVAISQYSTHKEQAWKFLEWLMSKDTQWKWVEGGGKTGISAILNDAKFIDAAPANRSFGRAMGMTKDYWHLATYPQLLQVYQQQVHDAITGKRSPQAALDVCGREHERILRKP